MKPIPFSDFLYFGIGVVALIVLYNSPNTRGIAISLFVLLMLIVLIRTWPVVQSQLRQLGVA